MIPELIEQLRRHEGQVNHAYQDHRGYWTIGVGRLIDERRGGGLSDEEVDVLLQNDVRRVLDRLASTLDFWHQLDNTQKQALANMAFQMGVDGLMGFQNMLNALGEGDGAKAEREALNSQWAQQTPDRAAEVAAMLNP